MDANVTVRRRIKDVTNLPSPGILRSQSFGTPSTSTASPRLMRTRSSPHVHFSSDPVSDVLEIPRVSVYPPLIPNKDVLSCLAPFLSPLEVNVGLFFEDLKTKDVREVGQLADMDSAMMQELKGLEAGGRKVKVVKRALRNYHRHLLKAKQTNTTQDKGVFKVKWRKIDSDIVTVKEHSRGHVILGNSRKWGKIDTLSTLEQKGDLKNKVTCGKSKEASSCIGKEKSAKFTLKDEEQFVKFKAFTLEEEDAEQFVEFKAFTSKEVEIVIDVKDGSNGNKENVNNETFSNSENDKEGDERFSNKENSTKSFIDMSSCISLNIPQMLQPISSDTFSQKVLHSKNDQEHVLDGGSLFSNDLEKAFSTFEEKLDENLENMSEENCLSFINQISRFQSKLIAIQEKVSNYM